MGATEFEKPLDNDLAAINTNLGSPTSASGVTGADAFSKINTVNTNLGSPSSASSVTGADAFTKINTLNSKITPTSITASRNTTNTSSGYITARKSAGITLINIAVTAVSASGWSTIGTISPAPMYQSYGAVFKTDGTAKLVLVQDTGDIKIYAPSAAEYSGEILVT